MRLYFILLLVCFFSCDQDIPYSTGRASEKKENLILFVTSVAFDGSNADLLGDGVPITSFQVKIYFDRLLDVSTITDDNISFVEEGTTNDIKTELKIVENDSNVIVFKISGLTYGTKYALSISKKVVSRDGYELDQDYAKEFQTEPVPKAKDNSLVVMYGGVRVPYSLTSDEFQIYTDVVTDVTALGVTLQLHERASLKKDGVVIEVAGGEHTATLNFASSPVHSYAVVAEDGSEVFYNITIKQFDVSSTSFTKGGQLGARYSVDIAIGAGDPISPQLNWRFAQTTATKSYIILCWDEDRTSNNSVWLVVDISPQITVVPEAGLVGRSLTRYQGLVLQEGQMHSIHFTVFSLAESAIPSALDDAGILAPQLVTYARKRLANVVSDPAVAPAGITVIGMADAQVFYTQQ